jgi:hypothetical protein
MAEQAKHWRHDGERTLMSFMIVVANACEANELCCQQAT